MNEETKIICYHGTTKESQESIFKEGFDESKPEQRHWLGRGIYFYQNIYYAIEWGIIHFINEDDTFSEYVSKCAVIEATLNLKDFEWIDLNDPIGYKVFLEIIEELKERFPKKIKKIEKDGDIELIRLIEKIEKNTGEDYISDFDIIMADYPKDIYKKGNKNQVGNFLPCVQKQICVKNKDVIQKIERMNLNSEIIEQYFDIIKENRKEYKNEKQHKITKKNVGKN